MEGAVALAILGAGNVRCAPPVIASLATFYGERPLQVRLYDADEERLDLMDRLARHCFAFTESTHELMFRPDLSEALEEADRIVVQLDENCAYKFLGDSRPHAGSMDEALEKMSGLLSAESDALSLMGKDAAIPLPFYRRLDWPPTPTDDELQFMPHQIMRWLRGDEMIYDLLQANEHSPFKKWLEDPTAAELIVSKGT